MKQILYAKLVQEVVGSLDRLHPGRNRELDVGPMSVVVLMDGLQEGPGTREEVNIATGVLLPLQLLELLELRRPDGFVLLLDHAR